MGSKRVHLERVWLVISVSHADPSVRFCPELLGRTEDGYLTETPLYDTANLEKKIEQIFEKKAARPA